jgi:hypothetical protein
MGDTLFETELTEERNGANSRWVGLEATDDGDVVLVTRGDGPKNTAGYYDISLRMTADELRLLGEACLTAAEALDG